MTRSEMTRSEMTRSEMTRSEMTRSRMTRTRSDNNRFLTLGINYREKMFYSACLRQKLPVPEQQGQTIAK
jgi:hypothetical protein